MAEYYHVRLAISEYEGQFRSELFTEDLGDTDGDLLPAEWNVMEDWIPSLAGGAGDLDSAGAREVGKQLYDYLLGHAENSKKWTEVLQQAERLQRPVRLLIDATSERVRDLPYGLLCEPHDNYFLLRPVPKRPTVQFVRILRRCTPRALRLGKPLRLLIAAAEPAGYEFGCTQSLCTLARSLLGMVELYFSTPQGVQRLEEAVAGYATEWRADQFAGFCKTTREGLRTALQQGPYDVLHVLAHGFGDSLWLCDAAGNKKPVQAEEMAAWCGERPLPMAFLQVCKGSATGLRGGFGGVAQQLLNPKLGDMAAVVASVYPLEAERSAEAAIHFYQRLAKGESPDAALDRNGDETDWTWAFLELWVRPQALGKAGRGAFQFVSPYRGLLRFEERDADIFFGRDAAVVEVLKILRDEPVLAIVGDSGSGKSSLLQAGIAHQVRKAGLGHSSVWQIVSTRPGDNPMHSVRNALSGADESAGSNVLSLLRERIRPDSPLLLIIDQFEELFTLNSSTEEPQVFAQALAQAVAQYPNDFRLVLGMRSDYLGSIAALPGLRDYLKRPWILKAPTAEDLRDIVEQPAAASGYTFEPARNDADKLHRISLLDRILDDPLVSRFSEQSVQTSDHAAPLPLIEFALERLWLKAVERESHEFTHADFDQLKGLAGAVGDYADQVYEDLSRQPALGVGAQALTEKIFMGVVTSSGTRRPRRRKELEEETRDAAQAKLVIDHLVGARLLTIRTDIDDPSASLMDLAHEILIASWKRLGTWLASTRDERRFKEELEDAATRWYERSRDDSYLDHKGPRLLEAEKLLQNRSWIVTQIHKEYLQACIKKRDHERNRERLIRTGAIVSALVLAVIAALALWQRSEAKQALLNALAKQLIANAATVSAQDPASALYLILRAANLTKQFPPEAYEVIISSLNARPTYGILRVPHLVDCEAWSPDGKTIASGSWDHKVRLWETNTGQLLKTLDGHSNEVLSLAWSPDGRTLVSSSRDGIRFWNAMTGEPLGSKISPGAESVAWRPDGKVLASCGHNGIRFWTATSGQTRYVLDEGRPCETMSWSPDGNVLVSGNAGQKMTIWDANNRQMLRTLEGHQNSVRSISWNPNGKAIASAGNDNTIRLWSAATGQLKLTIKGHTRGVESVAWSPDGRTIASGGGDSVARLWDAESGELLHTLMGHQSNVRSVAWSSKGQTLATASWDRTIRLWDIAEGSPLSTTTAHEESVFSIAWSPSGKVLASAGKDQIVRLWGPDAKHLLGTLRGHNGSVQSLTWNPNGDRLASSSADRTIRLWEPISGNLVRILNGHTSSVSRVDWSPDGKTLASVAQDDTIKLWDANSGKVLHTLAGLHAVDVAWSPDSKFLAFSGKDRFVHLWNVRLGERRALDGQDAGIGILKWSPDGKILACSNSSRRIGLLDIASGKIIRTLKDDHMTIRDVAWSPDGKVIASANGDSTTRLWGR